MRNTLLVLFLLAGSAQGQPQNPPDCQFTVTFTSATVGASFNNKTSAGATPCAKWRVAYFANGLSAVSIQLEGANDSAGAPGSWAAIASGSVYEGTNPITDANQGTAAMTAYYPWIRLNVTTFTTAGGAPHQIVARVYGYKGTSALTSQPLGNYITALTGDVTATGPGSAAAAVVKVNGGTVPASAHVMGSNASSQPVAASATDLSATVYVAGGGIAQAQTITLAPAVTALTNGLTVCWLPVAANTGAAPTLAVNATAAKPITKLGTTALVANDLTTTAVACAIYDGTEFQLQNPQTDAAITVLTGDVTATGPGSVAATIAAAHVAPAMMKASTFDVQSDGATVTWAIASVLNAQGTLTFTTHGGNRTLNITNPVIGGNYVLKVIQDATGGEGLILGTGCTWKVANGGAGTVTTTNAAGAVDLLTFTYDGANCLTTFVANLT